MVFDAGAAHSVAAAGDLTMAEKSQAERFRGWWPLRSLREAAGAPSEVMAGHTKTLARPDKRAEAIPHYELAP